MQRSAQKMTLLKVNAFDHNSCLIYKNYQKVKQNKNNISFNEMSFKIGNKVISKKMVQIQNVKILDNS